MFKAVRVILSLIPDGFLSGLSRARGGFSGFMGFLKNGISTGQMLFTGLNQAVELVGRAIRGISVAIKNLTDEFLGGAIAQEKFEVTLTSMIGDSEKAEQILDSLRERILGYGLEADSANAATIQFAMGLKGMTGDVDPDQLSTLLDYMQRITTVRDDIVGGEQAVARGIITALSGDFSTLTRLLDIPLDKLQGLSAEAQAFITGTQDATSKQLGKVTELAGQSEAQAGDAIAVLDELLNAAGITQGVVEDVSKTTGKEIDVIEANWEDFKRTVGEEVLPVVTEELGKFIDFIDEHREDIDKFAESLGKLAAGGLEELAQKLADTDWQQVGQDARDFGEDVRYIVEQIVILLEKLEKLGQWYQSAGGLMDTSEGGNIWWGVGDAGGAGGAAGIGQQSAEQVRGGIFSWLNEMGPKVFPGADQNQEASQQTPSQGPQEVTVRVVVDGEQNIRAAVDNAARAAASEEIGAFTDEVVRSTGAGH